MSRRRGWRSLVLVLVLAMTAAATAHGAEPLERLLVVRSDGVHVWFDVEVASSHKARRTGLMGRTSLGRRHGMWFDFGRDTEVVMWMKDTPIPLDMVFVNGAGVVIDVRAETEPLSRALIRAPAPARYVLEILGGAARRLALAPGDRVVLSDPP